MKIDNNLKNFITPILQNVLARSRWVSYEIYQKDGIWAKKLVQGTGEVKYLLNPDGFFIDGKKIDLDYL
jgi:hypothetical protein